MTSFPTFGTVGYTVSKKHTKRMSILEGIAWRRIYGVVGSLMIVFCTFSSQSAVKYRP